LEASRVRVLVVDDYEPFRRFVCATLSEREDMQVVGEATDGLNAIRKAEEMKPDLIVLDIGLPTLNGIEAGRRIRKLCAGVKILFLSQEARVEVAQKLSIWGHRPTSLKHTQEANWQRRWKRSVRAEGLSVRGYWIPIGPTLSAQKLLATPPNTNPSHGSYLKR
jgi:DNA-binding NarL/FixJ family response regulator